MRTAVTQTSRDAYHKLRLQPKEQAVLDAMGDKAWCISDLAIATGKDKSEISARLNGLKKKKRVEKVGEWPSEHTKISSEHWRKIRQIPKIPKTLFSTS
jgi:predicted Rossmann fold nucleotide-binding protein DprA/Smf involved in DNA uptake